MGGKQKAKQKAVAPAPRESKRLKRGANFDSEAAAEEEKEVEEEESNPDATQAGGAVPPTTHRDSGSDSGSDSDPDATQAGGATDEELDPEEAARRTVGAVSSKLKAAPHAAPLPPNRTSATSTFGAAAAAAAAADLPALNNTLERDLREAEAKTGAAAAAVFAFLDSSTGDGPEADGQLKRLQLVHQFCVLDEHNKRERVQLVAPKAKAGKHKNGGHPVTVPERNAAGSIGCTARALFPLTLFPCRSILTRTVIFKDLRRSVLCNLRLL
jgi:hypothetical protein